MTRHDDLRATWFALIDGVTVVDGTDDILDLADDLFDRFVPARARPRSSGPRGVDGADVPDGENRESVWIGPARRHGASVRVAAGPA